MHGKMDIMHTHFDEVKINSINYFNELELCIPHWNGYEYIVNIICEAAKSNLLTQQEIASCEIDRPYRCKCLTSNRQVLCSSVRVCS